MARQKVISVLTRQSTDMKFGKRMRSLAIPIWEHEYIDYKRLKQHIKGLQSGPDAPYDVFYTLLEREMIRLNEVHQVISNQLQFEELDTLQRTLGTRWVLCPSRGRLLLLGAIELSRKIDAFRQFIVLNSLALVKISKKFDKTFTDSIGHELKRAVLDALEQQAFYDGQSLDTLFTETAQLTDRIMLCLLPDGNYIRPTPHHVSCPVCLHGQVKLPITLACGHTFCWACLSQAAEHQFQCCPLCRTIQSIDPRDYAVDGLLKRFIRIYGNLDTDVMERVLSSSPMRQILVEGLNLVSSYLQHIESQYAALSPRSKPQTFENKEQGQIKLACSPTSVKNMTNTVNEEKSPCESMTFAKNDVVDVLYNGRWYPGMILHPKEDSATYSVLWWMEDGSQRCGQRMPHHLLRVPDIDNSSSPSLWFEIAAGVWNTASEWALSPLEALRKLTVSSPPLSESSKSSRSDTT